MNTKSKEDGFRLFYFRHEYLHKKKYMYSLRSGYMVVRDGGIKLSGYAHHVVRRQ